MDLKHLNEDYEKYLDKQVSLKGWVKNHRKQKNFGFIDFFDGTCFKTVQVVYEQDIENFDEVQKFKIGSCIEVEGKVIKSQGKNQLFEVKVSKLVLLGDCTDDYPIQPKPHSREFLREQAYLRPRTNLFQAVFRIRSLASMAIHTYFQQNGYVYVHTPLITTADCEGSDQMFKITTLNFDNLPKKEDGTVDIKKDLFGKLAYITGSGQLHGEAMASAFNKIYTFGPTFRTENSNTKTHANEFWMIEPEISFCDLDMLMDIEEDSLKFITKYVLEKAPDDLKFLDTFVQKGLIDKLNGIVNSKFVRIDHADAIKLLKQAKVKWEFEPEEGGDLAKEHEKYLTEHFNGPVFVKNWPKEIKSYYMKLNPDNKTVAAVDLLVPGSGELMGGSQREENYDKLVARCKELGVATEAIDWYLNLRKFGTCVHSGFGMGFERLIMYLTGIDNIRDAIPFPRTPNNCLY